MKLSEALPTSMNIQRVLPPNEWKDKQINTLKAVGRRNYLVGIASPKRSPIGAGSSDWSEEKYAAAIVLAVENKSRQKGVAKSDDSIWYKYAKELGANNLVDGVVKREAKVLDFIQAFHPKLTSHLSKIDEMAVSTLEERISKSAENIRGLAALRGSV